MGREIRRVPPNWEHPRYTEENAPSEQAIGGHIPLFDKTYEEALQNGGIIVSCGDMAITRLN